MDIPHNVHCVLSWFYLVTLCSLSFIRVSVSFLQPVLCPFSLPSPSQASRCVGSETHGFPSARLTHHDISYMCGRIQRTIVIVNIITHRRSVGQSPPDHPYRQPPCSPPLRFKTAVLCWPLSPSKIQTTNLQSNGSCNDEAEDDNDVGGEDDV